MTKATTRAMIDGQGVLEESGGRFVLRFERRLAHPPDRVWHHITDPEGLALWFPARVHYDELAVGAELTFRFSEEDLARARDAGVEGVPLVSRGVIRELEPGRVFAFDWDGEPVRFELAPDGAGTRLVFTHTFDRDPAQAPRNATGWHVCLEGLEAALDGRAGPGEERQAQLMPVYLEAMR